ncbi:MAG: hypothetical protein WBO36_14870, partial [Saprospiraceae bacterium]
MGRFKLTIILSFFITGFLQSQVELAKAEMDLAYDCDVMVNAFEARHRLIAMTKFNESFLKTLENKGSFKYPFDSLKWISKKYPKDNTFRIIT